MTLWSELWEYDDDDDNYNYHYFFIIILVIIFSANYCYYIKRNG